MRELSTPERRAALAERLGTFIPTLPPVAETGRDAAIRREIGEMLTSFALVRPLPRAERGKPKHYIGEHPGGPGHPYGEDGA